jgi:hypothetical protein
MLQQLARILGREDVESVLGADPANVSELNDSSRASLEGLIRARKDEFVAAISSEAADNDDVSDADSAFAYGESRLNDFAAIIPADLRADVLRLLRDRTSDWG